MRDRSLLTGTVVAVLSLLGYWVLVGAVETKPWVVAFDAAAESAIVALRTPWLTSVMRVVTVTGGFVVVTVGLTLLVAWQVRAHRNSDALFSLVVVAAGTLVSTIAKGRIQRLRPPAELALITLPTSYSFPSGHSMASLCLGAAVAREVLHSELSTGARTLWLLLCVAYPLLVGVSRVFLGVHYPSDVVASWLLGLAIVAVAWGFASHRAQVESASAIGATAT